MSATEALRPPGPATPQTAIVVVGDAAACADIAALLTGTGREAVIADAEDVPREGLAVVATEGRALERVRALQRVLDARPELLAVALMPDDAPNAPLRRALQAGAVGIVRDGDAELALVPTLDAILSGQLAVPFAVGAVIAPRALSHREKEILGLVAEGCTNREIAGRLFIAESTVKTHLSSAFEKLDATSRADAIERMAELRDESLGWKLASDDDDA